MSTRESVVTDGVPAPAPRGHVRITAAPLTRPVTGRAASPRDPASSWSIVDGRSAVVVDGVADRASALRLMGVLALRGAYLPLALRDPQGRPTGDNLAG